MYKKGLVTGTNRAVLRRSTMFIALNRNHSALQRSAMCFAIIHIHAAPTERKE